MDALITYTLKNAAAILKVPCDSEAMFKRVSTDSRTLERGDLFVALKGPNFDGHSHVAQAESKGAVGAVVSEIQAASLPQLQVKDTRLALAAMAKARRAAFKGKVVALTGSNGKTTVKELISAILRQSGKVLATPGNFNNDIGLPLTLLTLKGDEDYAVIEMGANHSGEIAFLTDITNPDIALITNAGAAHLEGFGDVKGVSRAKGEIYSGLKEKGKAVVNLDDKYGNYWRELTTKFDTIGFAIDAEGALISASNIQEIDGVNRFTLKTPAGECEITLNLPGVHSVQNALAAVAVCYALKIDLDKVEKALAEILPVKGRLNFLKGHNNSLIIDDTYNANRDSMKAAIDVLSKREGRKIVVFADLFESGENSVSIHQEIGAYAKQSGLDELYTLGELSENAIDLFQGEGRGFSNKEELINQLQNKQNANVTILVKGSRGMKMEEVVEQLIIVEHS